MSEILPKQVTEETYYQNLDGSLAKTVQIYDLVGKKKILCCKYVDGVLQEGIKVLPEQDYEDRCAAQAQKFIDIRKDLVSKQQASREFAVEALVKTGVDLIDAKTIVYGPQI